MIWRCPHGKESRGSGAEKRQCTWREYPGSYSRSSSSYSTLYTGWCTRSHANISFYTRTPRSYSSCCCKDAILQKMTKNKIPKMRVADPMCHPNVLYVYKFRITGRQNYYSLIQLSFVEISSHRPTEWPWKYVAKFQLNRCSPKCGKSIVVKTR